VWLALVEVISSEVDVLRSGTAATSYACMGIVLAVLALTCAVREHGRPDPTDELVAILERTRGLRPGSRS
jgi:hypothetical protein